MPLQVLIQQHRIKWLACKMLGPPERASVFNQVAASSSGFALLTAFV